TPRVPFAVCHRRPERGHGGVCGETAGEIREPLTPPETDCLRGLFAMLTADELERYARHIVLREVGGPGQAALKGARVLVVGAGGLGAPALLYLAAAGVGTIAVVDDDTVSLSNLQRQVIHGTPDIGQAKTE